MTSKLPTISPGQIRFFDNFVPPLHDGRYKISVSQAVTGATGDTFSADQNFEINGPRFSIDASLVHAQFPPPNHSGMFEEQLPQIVLKKRSLPWERLLNPTDDQAPWVCLLLLDAGSGGRATATVANGKVTAITVTDPGSGYQIAPSVAIQGVGSGAVALATIDDQGQITGITVTAPGSGYSQTSPTVLKIGSTTNSPLATVGDLLTPGNDVFGHPIAAPVLTLNPDFEKTTDPCQIIDIPVNIFKDMVPRYDPANTLDELAFASHVRQVDTGDKEPLGMKAADGWFSVIIAKRFPRSNGGVANRQIAHLVTIEGFGDKLTGSPNFGSSKMVRMASLASWTFTCLPQTGETFAQLMNDLITTQGHSDYLLKPAYKKPEYQSEGTLAQAQKTLELGYLPMPYQTRQGEHNFAFYRGPLAPVVPPKFTPTDPIPSPSAAAIYNKVWGLFDQSYAVAFQTGRLLALSDRNFGTNLLSWRRTGHQLTNLLAERLNRADVSALIANTNNVATQARILVEKDIVSKSLMAWLVDDVTKQVAPKLSTPSPNINQTVELTVAETGAAPNQTIADLQNTLASPPVQSVLQELSGWDSASSTFTNTLFKQICEWLSKLALLENVPFNNMVPNSAMLPQSGIRYFYIDNNMVSALIDGAMSVAGQTSRDTLYYGVMRDVIVDATYSILHQVRQKVMDKPLTPANKQDGPVTGFLLRSAVVSGWPGLEVKGFSSVVTAPNGLPEGQGQIPLLRMIRLADDIMLVLFAETPAWVQIDEPGEGLAFGVEDGRGTVKAPVWVRHLVGNAVGAQFGTDPTIDAVDATPAIDPVTGVIDLMTMRQLLEQNALLAAELTQKPYSTGKLSPGDFALQMVKLPERMIFQAKP